MDVHLPHHPLHTWKDFWIHLGTITVGLLIAISLEQSVEKLHQLHQRHQLEEDLRTEAWTNLAILDGDYRYLDWSLGWDDAYRNNLETMRASGGKIKLPYRPFYPPAGMHSIMVTSSAWTTAKESNLVALLPRDEAEMYDRVYFELKTYEDVAARRTEFISEEVEFEGRFATAMPPIRPDLARMTPDELGQLSDIISKQLSVSRQVRSRMDVLYEAERVAANGARTQSAVLDAIARRQLANRP